MNVTLHIDSVVLDGIDLAPDRGRLLQQTVAAQLTAMLAQKGDGFPVADPNNPIEKGGNSIRLGHPSDAMSLGTQLANAIYANIPQSQIGSRAAHGGQ